MLLHRDAHVLILNKPANIAVHPGFGDSNTLNLYFDQLQFGLPNPPQLAHRLDRATSGCLVLGRHRQALQRLQQLFAMQQAEKCYHAVVVGLPPDAQGVVDAPLSKQTPAAHRWWMQVDADGQSARTEYKVLATHGGLSLLELKPKTGRTHQLRVHTMVLGTPILGEWVYHGNCVMPYACPLQLHARSIKVPYAEGKPAVSAQAPYPAHMLEVLEKLGLNAA